MAISFGMVQIAQWIGWVGAHWVGILSCAFAIGFIYVFTALMLDLRMPGEHKAK